MDKIIDIKNIENKIKKIHNSFLKDVGNLTYKITADYQLQIARIDAKISIILQLFKENQIIDGYNEIKKDILGFDLSYKKYILYKNGFDKKVIISANNNTIALKDDSFMVALGFNAPTQRYLTDINVDKYNWEDFAVILLSYIHLIIYDRKEAYNLAIFGV